MTIADTAREMASLGLQVLPAKEDGTKAPLAIGGAWKSRQTVPTTNEELARWYETEERNAIGVVCGAISGNLTMFEFEGRAVHEGWFARFEAAIDAAGLGDLWQRVAGAYVEATPSGGIHFYWRVADGPAPTRKVARRLKREDEYDANDLRAAKARVDKGLPEYRAPLVMVETKGEGGYSITAPTNGTTHPTGKAWTVLVGTWADVPTLTVAEMEQLLAIAAGLDEWEASDTARNPVPRPATVPGGMKVLREGSERPGEAYNATHSCGDVLLELGFTLARTDGEGTHWTRPGKDARAGTSATVWADNGLATVFSTSVDIGDKIHGEHALDPFGLLAALAFHGDRSAAARHLAGDRAATELVGASPVIVAPTAAGEGAPPSRPVLPAALWGERPYLDQIRRAAYSRARCPDVVLATVLARVAAFVPHWVVLPAVVGTRAPLCLFVLVASDSADGKSSAMAVGRELLPMPTSYTIAGVVDPFTPTTGAGLIEAFMGEVKEEDPSGKTTKGGEPVMVPVRRQVRHHLYAEVDEGSRLVKAQERNGDLFPTLCTMFSGGALGSGNASKDLYRRVDALNYSAGLVIGWQARNLRPLIADADSGTPGRFLFVQAIDPAIRIERPEWPGALPFTLADLGPVLASNRAADGFFEMGIDPAVAAEIAADDIERASGRRRVEVIDGHRGLVRLKVAALLGILDGRLAVSADDWRLAGVIVDNSDAVRAWAISIFEEADRVVVRERHAIEETARTLARGSLPMPVLNLAQRIGRRVARADGPETERNVRRAVVNSKRGDGAIWADALDLALEAGYVERDAHSGLIPGPVAVPE